MSMTQTITNPDGAFGYTTLDQTSGRIYGEYRTSAPGGGQGQPAVGDVVVFDSLAADGIVTVHKADVSADDVALVAGVAIEASGATGDVIKVVRAGPVRVNIGNGTVAAGERATFHASTDGCADSANADATTITGDTFGVMLGAEIGTTDKAVLDVRTLG